MLRSMTVLQVRDVNKSVAFYCEKLGFKSHGIWSDGSPEAHADFAIIQAGKVTIALDRSQTGNPLPINQYWAAYIYVENADTLFAQAKSKGVEILQEPGDRFYGLRDFSVRDIDGHILSFGHDLKPGALEPGLVDPAVLEKKQK